MLETLFHWQVANFRMKWPHVIAVRQAEVFVKAILLREKLVMMSQMPLTKTGGGVSFLLTKFSQSHLVRMNALIGIWPQRAQNSESHVVATCQQTGTRCRANGLRNVEVRKLPALCSHLIQVRS